MNLDNLSHTSGEWLRGAGPEVDIVMSSRIRLARNLAAFPFTNRAGDHQKSDLETSFCAIGSAKLDITPRLNYFTALPQLSRSRSASSLSNANLSVARFRQPRDRVAWPSTISETVSVMVNEEDQLRLASDSCERIIARRKAWQEIDRFDDAIEQRVTYAFHEEFGYLTACPTNVGTGITRSVLLHFARLGLDQADRKGVSRCKKINLAVRGLYSGAAAGHPEISIKISNQVTLGKAESAILDEIHEGHSRNP